MLEITRTWIELAAAGIELLAVAVILLAIVQGAVRYFQHIRQRNDNPYDQFKRQLGRAMLLGLEFLVAADIIRTVALEPSVRNVSILGLLVIIRTFLSWSLIVEIEGHWPWQSERKRGA